MQTLSWRHLEIFRAVMTTPNLTEAALLLNTSQPTISRELARLEHLLQFKLFDCIKGRLRPTAQGLRFFEEVERSYYGLERIKNSAQKQSDALIIHSSRLFAYRLLLNLYCQMYVKPSWLITQTSVLP